MVIFSLDANALVDLMRGEKPHVHQRWAEARATDTKLKLSTIAVHELRLGADLSRRPDRQHAILDAFLDLLEVEPWTAEDAAATGALRADFKRRGDRIGAYDTLIAGQALARGWTVVTANVHEFIRVSGLRFIDWSDPTGPVEYQG